MALGPALCGHRACDDRRVRRAPRRSRPYLRDLASWPRSVELAALPLSAAARAVVRARSGHRAAARGRAATITSCCSRHRRRRRSASAHLASRLALRDHARSAGSRPATGVRLVDAAGAGDRGRGCRLPPFLSGLRHGLTGAAVASRPRQRVARLVSRRAVAQRLRFCHVPRRSDLPSPGSGGLPCSLVARQALGWLTHIIRRHRLRRPGVALRLCHQPPGAERQCRDRPDAGDLGRGAGRRARLSQPAIPRRRDRRHRDPDHARRAARPARRDRLPDRRGAVGHAPAISA